MNVNPLAVDEDEEDNDGDVYDQDGFEPFESQTPNGQNNAQNSQAAQSGLPVNSNIQSNTFYAGQNSKFFDKRILASQKQNRPKNNFGQSPNAEVDQPQKENNFGGGYSPHIKQQKKNVAKAKPQRQNGLPNVNESFKNTSTNQQSALPSLSRTGNNFNPNPENRREGGPNAQRVASRRTSTRQKTDKQGARIIHSRQRQEQFNDFPQNVYTLNMNSHTSQKMSPEQSHSKISFANYQGQPRGQPQPQGGMTHKVNTKNSFKIKQIPVDFNPSKDMENEVREHLNLAHYNFNRMAVIDEEGVESGQNRRGGRGGDDQLMSAGQDRRGSKNMHNTTSNFYLPRFGDRLPTRGEVQSRGRQNLIPSAQGTRRGNSRAENSLGRVQKKQIS